MALFRYVQCNISNQIYGFAKLLVKPKLVRETVLGGVSTRHPPRGSTSPPPRKHPPRRKHPPCGQTDTCKNITFAKPTYCFHITRSIVILVNTDIGWPLWNLWDWLVLLNVYAHLNRVLTERQLLTPALTLLNRSRTHLILDVDADWRLVWMMQLKPMYSFQASTRE